MPLLLLIRSVGSLLDNAPVGALSKTEGQNQWIMGFRDYEFFILIGFFSSPK